MASATPRVTCFWTMEISTLDSFPLGDSGQVSSSLIDWHDPNTTHISKKGSRYIFFNILFLSSLARIYSQFFIYNIISIKSALTFLTQWFYFHFKYFSLIIITCNKRVHAFDHRKVIYSPLKPLLTYHFLFFL